MSGSQGPVPSRPDQAFLSMAAIRAAVAGSWLRRPPEGSEPTGLSIDTREGLVGKVFLAIRGERFEGNAFAADAARLGAALVVVDRAVGELPGTCGVLAVADGRRALGEIAHAWRKELASLTVIGVTGSAGKTTTRRLIHGALAEHLRGSASPKSFNNEIGVPLTLLAARPSDDYLVAEIGMSHPGEIHHLAGLVEPQVGVITMVGRAHLEGMGSIEAIAREKTSLLERLPAGGLAVVRGDSEAIQAALLARDLGVSTIVRFGHAGRDLDLRLTRRTPTADGQVIEVNDRDRFTLRLPGEHNALNALAAIAVARWRGLGEDDIRAGLASVEPAGMRLERLTRGGVEFFNDAYNANPDAMVASIKAFAELTPHAERRVLVLGDMLELGGESGALHEEVGRVAGEVHRATPIHAAILVGAFATDTHRGLVGSGWQGESTVVAQLDPVGLAAVQAALRPGDAALLKGSRGSAMERILAALAGRETAAAH